MSANPSLEDAGRAQRSTASPRWRGLRTLSRALVWLIFAASAVLFACWLSLHWLILPHIDEWRVPLETRASRLLGAAVKIGAISARSSGWVPAVELRDVRVLDAEGRVALALPKVHAALSARSLLALELRFDQLLIDGASLDIRRDPSGRIRVAGLDFASGSGKDDDDVGADWFFRQHEVVIRGGTLRWIDDARQAPPLALGNVEIVVRNGLRRHELRLDATPPAGWGERFSLRGVFAQPLFAGSGEWRRWSGTAYADLPRADVRELRRHVALPFELSEGDGAVRGWFDVKDGEPVGATVDVSLRAVTLRLAKDVEPLEFEQVQGRINAEKKGERIAVAVRRFGFLTGDAIRWPQGDLDIAWNRDQAGAVTGGEFAAERLDVGVMAQIAGRVPLGKAVRALLADVAPRGVITRLKTRWDGPLDAPGHYRIEGLLSDLSLAARPAARIDTVGRPGLRNAAVELHASETGGQARVDIRAGLLDLPGVFAERELPLDRLNAKLAWKVEPGRGSEPAAVVVEVGAATFANADAHGELTATWRTGKTTSGRYPGELVLDGRLTEARAERAARYLPLGLPRPVRDYVAGAVRGGTIASADVRVRGDLHHFPFHDARTARDSELRIAATVRDMTFAYIPGDVWPPLTAVAGELVIDHDQLTIRNARARLQGVDWSRIDGRIARLDTAPRLDLAGTARGPLAEMLRFVNATPLGVWSAGALAQASGNGTAELQLGLAVPLDRPEATAVKAGLVLGGNDVRMTPDTPLLGGARGRVDITEKGFAVSHGTAQVLGGALAFEGGSATPGDGIQRFTGQGTFSAEALRQASELGTVAWLGNAMTGQGSYKAALTFAAGRPQIDIASNLVGVAVQLPAPFTKAAATALPLRVRTGPEIGAAVGSAAASAPLRESLRVEVGSALQAHIVREWSGDSARVVRGAIRIGEAGRSDAAPADELALPARGVAATVALKRIDVGEWQAAADRVLPPAAPRPAGGTPAPPLVFDSAGGEGYVPDTIALSAGEIETGSRRLGNVSATLAQQAGLWRADVTADELAGHVEYRPARRGTTAAGRVFARLSRLSLAKGEAERVESLLDQQPASIPGLDIVVDDFELRGRRLGRLEIEAANRAVAGAPGRETAREWQLSKLKLVMPEAQFAATGTWGAPAAAATGSPAGAPRRASIDFHLALADSGALLERLGMGRVVKGGKGSLTGEVSWPGSPLSPDTARMTGQVKVAIEAGQFLKASPGAARLLGVLSLQSLPRRLLLDFRDVFAEGFAFDDVIGDVKIGDGLASTNNLRMRGAAAAVLMEGSADLEHETQDLRALVVPEINAGTAALAFAVINPAVGLGTFLAQYFLRAPLIAASTREFHVTGPWDDPKVERVERSPSTASPP